MSEHEAPPAGGFGAPEAGQMAGVEHRASPPRASFRGFHTVMIVLGALFLGWFLLVVWGEWKRAKEGRRAEAVVRLGDTAKRAIEAYEARRELCPSAASIPRDFESVRGKKYPPTPEDVNDPGWKCLGFDREYPIAYQYRYEASGSFVTIIAVGDLDGNDLRSTYEMHGHVDPATDRLVFDGSIRETNPGE